MKIAISTSENNLKGEVSELFGRCPYFVIVEIDDQKVVNTEIIKNDSEKQMSGAGVSTSRLIAEKEVEAVITGNVGPRAKEILDQFNIQIYLDRGKIEDAINDYINGKLEKAK